MPPKWRVLADQLAADIAAGAYGPGDRLPGQSDLLVDGYSSSVVQDAMRHLASRGLIESRVGSGYYVLPEPPADWMARLRAVEEELIGLKARVAELEERNEG